METLPNELLIKIFGNLPRKDRHSLNRVNKRIRRSWNDPARWTHFAYTGSSSRDLKSAIRLHGSSFTRSMTIDISHEHGMHANVFDPSVGKLLEKLCVNLQSLSIVCPAPKGAFLDFRLCERAHSVFSIHVTYSFICSEPAISQCLGQYKRYPFVWKTSAGIPQLIP
jgi:hypothetical protein